MIRDIWSQAWEAMIYNRRRTFITVVGMAWGIATVVLLLAYGAGFGQAIQNIFEQWGTYLIGVFPGKTSEQVGGAKAGVDVRLTPDDVDSRRAPAPRASSPPGAHTDAPTHAAVLAQEEKPRLFGGRYPLGSRIRLNGIGFTVIGVLEPKMQEGDDDVNRQIYIPFNTFEDFGDLKYLGGIWLTYHGDNQVVEQAVRNTLAAMHNFLPSDRNAIFVANLIHQLRQFQIITIALEGLLLFIGALTLGIAG